MKFIKDENSKSNQTLAENIEISGNIKSSSDTPPELNSTKNNCICIDTVDSDTNNNSIKEIPQKELNNIIEALLFSENNPISLSRLAEISNATPEAIRNAISGLSQEYELTERAFRIEKVSNGFQLYTLSKYSQWVRQLYKTSYHRLSHPALETLAIIIYNQPVTRPEIEKLRGVDCSGPLLTLLERRLIRIEGRAKKPGGPFLYGTGKEFLRYFGLTTLNDLPSKDELEAFLQQRGEQL